jgi:hypothetical protein
MLSKPSTISRVVGALMLAGLSSFTTAALSQSSPYYIGVAQTFTYESNLLRLREGQVAPAGGSANDTISSTALVAGIDQSFGRQRLSGSASLRTNRYADNDQFNSAGYSLNLGLDWETIERLSGNVNVGADRTQRADLRDRQGRFIGGGNAEDAQRVSATVRLGMAGPLSIEAGVNYNNLAYEAAAASYAEYSQTGGSLGVRYRLGGATSLGVGLRSSRSVYPNLLISQADPRDKRQRTDIDFNVVWVPSGSSKLDATLSQGRTRYDQLSDRDFSGATGALVWTYNPGGRFRGNLRAARDTGQSSDLATTAFSQITDSLRVAADYDVTGKIVASASLQTYRRQLDNSGQFLGAIRGKDTGHVATFGLRWAALRSLTVGCQASYDKRGANSTPALNDRYSAKTASCYGQFVLQ